MTASYDGHEIDWLTQFLRKGNSEPPQVRANKDADAVRHLQRQPSPSAEHEAPPQDARRHQDVARRSPYRLAIYGALILVSHTAAVILGVTVATDEKGERKSPAVAASTNDSQGPASRDSTAISSQGASSPSNAASTTGRPYDREFQETVHQIRNELASARSVPRAP